MYQNGFNRKKVMEIIKKNNQGFQSYRHGECLYRGDVNGDVNSCLIGCFIPDDKYTQNMEGREASDVIDHYKLDTFMPMNTKCMEILQRFHDEDLDQISGKKFYDAIEEKLVDLELLFK